MLHVIGGILKFPMRRKDLEEMAWKHSEHYYSHFAVEIGIEQLSIRILVDLQFTVSGLTLPLFTHTFLGKYI